MKRFIPTLILVVTLQIFAFDVKGQEMPTKYAFFELFTNTPCVICGSQNPGFFSRLDGYPDQYHQVSFYPGSPYTSCIFYQANKDENKDRLNFYPGQIFGSPTVITNGLESSNPNGVTNSDLMDLTGGESWLQIGVEEEGAANRAVTIRMDDFSGEGTTSPLLFAVIVEREVMYDAPNGETVHHNVFRQFLTPTEGVEVDMVENTGIANFNYDLSSDWDESETYVVAWATDGDTKEIINSGTRFDQLLSTNTKEISLLENIKIFPNPATHEIKISSDVLLSASDVSLKDIHGRLITKMRVDIGQDIFRMDLTKMLPGHYHLSIRNENRVFNTIVQVLR